jgi:iron complex transport system ATP-binding protein
MKGKLHIDNVTIGHKANTPLFKGISAEVNSGELLVLVGENGKGKTTFIKTICGVLPALSGTIKLGGLEVQTSSPGKLAEEVAVVLTEQLRLGNTTVRSLIAFGRYPYTNWLGLQGDQDRQLVEQALKWCAIEHLADKQFAALSDGERQKVMIARAIAQDTPMLVLDEPAAHLDIANRLAILKLLHFLSKEQGKTIIYSTHQVELALQYADRMWLLHENTLHDASPRDMLDKGLLNAAFHVEDDYFKPFLNRFTK